MTKLSNIFILIGILCFLAYGLFLAGYENFAVFLLLGFIFLIVALIMKIVFVTKQLKAQKK